MRLPRLPNGFVKARTQTMQFLGVNLTENYQDGEMSDCKNLSTLQYPTLSQRKGRDVVEGYSDVADMYTWDNKLIIVDNSTLYVDNVAVTSVTNSKKQFAVVNSKLIVFPDKISVDLRNNELKQLEGTVQTTGATSSVTFTHNSIEAPLQSKIASYKSFGYESNSEQHTFSPYMYTYGTNRSNVGNCWNESTSSWDLTALESLKETAWIGTDANNVLTGDISVTEGHIFIPKVTGVSSSSYRPVTGNVAGKTVSTATITPPDTTEYNSLGYIGVITDVDPYWIGTGNTFECRITYDIYDVQNGNVQFSSVFEVGDYVDVTGSLHGLLDTTYNGDDNTTSSKIAITEVVDATAISENKLVFADNTFTIPYSVLKLSSAKNPDNYYVRAPQPGGSSSYYYFTFTASKKIEKNQVIVLYGTDSTQDICIWDITKHKIVARYTGTRATSAPSSGYTNIGNTSLYDTSSRVITINRSIPDLDFICERDNRLWGVSNTTKTIYCSALGIPWQFYDYSGLDTGAYAVAVGSAGDFTGIVNYGGVLCFKEDKVHKMLGSFPSDFYMTTYNVAGIMNGADKSAVIVSEILYYRSPLGVMAFTGYQPTNISPNLSLEHTTGGVAGSNGREYFLCVRSKDDTEKYSLFKYDLQYKLWIKEDDVNVSSITNIGNDLYITIETKDTIEVEGETKTIITRTPYITNQQNDEGMNLEWFARFMPYIETQGGVRQAGYTRLVLRFDMAPGSRFKIKVRYDDGRWEDAWTQPKTKKLTYTVPLRIKRCDKFELMLEGKGQTKIRSIQREFVRGGWYDGSNIY